MKAIEQSFLVLLFITLYKVVRTFHSVDETPLCNHSNENYWVVLSCDTVHYARQGGSKFLYMDKALLLLCDHSNESFWTMLLCGTVKGGSNFWIWMKPQCVNIEIKLLSSTFTWYCLLCCTRWFELFSLWTKLPCVTVHVKAIEEYFLMILFVMLNKVVSISLD